MPHSSIDPARFASLGLTHVQYDASDPLAKLLALVTLSPIFLLCAYFTIILYRRELTFINALLGQLGCEGLNWFLKRLLRHPRPYPGALGKGYGMPSSHSQFVGFFAAFFLAHFWLHHPAKARPRTLINTMRRAEHVAVMLAIVALTILTCYSRYHLAYHTTAQIGVGLAIGLIVGGVYYYITEYLSRQPLRLPAPLGSPIVSPDASPRVVRRPSDRNSSALRRRGDGQAAPHSQQQLQPHSQPTQADEQIRPRRRSSLSSLVPDLHPAPPLRQMILDHPLAVAFRVRDSWTVWRDGGIEGEYGTWRREWERRREWFDEGQRSASANSNGSAAVPGSWFASSTALIDAAGLKVKEPALPASKQSRRRYQLMLHALRLADQCPPTQTAFCVGCVITPADSEAVLATGFSRELEGNTHAEQCALTKLEQSIDMGIDGHAQGAQLDLYTTMEPCSERLSGAAPCVTRILEFNAKHAPRWRIVRVCQGVSEPDDFVQCQGARTLREAGIEVCTVRAIVPYARIENGSAEGTEEDWQWLEKECLRVAKFGHADQPAPQPGVEKLWKD